MKVYSMPLVRLPTKALVAGAVTLRLAVPGLTLMRYSVIAAPPSLAGGVQLTVAPWSAAVAVTPVGAPGAVAGVPPPGTTGLLFTLAGEVSEAAFVALTVKV